MLNLTRLHLGIAHESQFQGLGISHLALRGELEPVLATAGADYARHWRGVHREPLCRVLVARRRQ